MRITATGRDQYLGIVQRHLQGMSRHGPRPAAARRLIEAYADAVQQISVGPKSWFTHPRPYPALAQYGFRWIKVHRYWFAYVPDTDPIVTNILDETSDMPAHASADRTPASLE